MRLSIHITGIVQGVGFRPFVFRLAQELRLNGYVLNDTSGVTIEAEGEDEALHLLLLKIETEKPPNARIYSLQFSFLEEKGFEIFEIRHSREKGEKNASILPDICTCSHCLAEITDPRDRRFRYPFTNCTDCGPRFTIVNSLPYDRENTSMHLFTMCNDCAAEYTTPGDRRFHAQPNACHVCGPWVSLYERGGTLLCREDEALTKAILHIREGKIVAVKGIGGYHLLCDALNDIAVRRLRTKKGREERPLAVMFPSLASVRVETAVGALEERAINSVEKPIVIVNKREGSSIAPSVSPDCSTVGVFLPYAPLHYMILQELGTPVVATSGNISDEPIVRNENEAFERLAPVADYILSHNREIARRCDDSVIRMISDRQVPIRRSRGYAPMPVMLPFRLSRPVLALGAHMNNTIALGIDNMAFLSQHIGDIDNTLCEDFFEETVRDFLKLFDVRPAVVVSDLHPGYYSTAFGERHYGDQMVKIQHHFAHILSCMADNDIPPKEGVIGFAFDGTGYGTDGTIWGSETLIVSDGEYRRMCHLRPFRLPGGEKAIREPRRTAFSLLLDTYGSPEAIPDILPLSETEKSFFTHMLMNHVNSPLTTGMGRLFDGVSSITGCVQRASYHAQPAVLLEQMAMVSGQKGAYPLPIEGEVVDYRMMIGRVVDDIRAGMPRAEISRKFHNSVIHLVVNTAESLKKLTGIDRIALSGGVFQNNILLEDLNLHLTERGFIPLTHQQVPSNDGGISLGQIVAAGLQA